MKYFRNMSEIESINWKKGAILGFYIYMLLLFINYIYSLIYGTEPITSVCNFLDWIVSSFWVRVYFKFKVEDKLIMVHFLDNISYSAKE